MNHLARNSFIKPMVRLFRAAAVLIRNTAAGDKNNPRKRLSAIPKTTASGTRYDLYEREKTIGKTVIVVSGLTLQGERDPRLVRFSRALAKTGVSVAAVSLPALKKCRFEEEDVSVIIDLAATLSAAHGRKISIIGFSFGAGLALVAAADPAAKDIIDTLILFGPYFNLSEIFDIVYEYSQIAPADDSQWDTFIWLRLLTAFRFLEKLSLNENEKAGLIDFLGNYCMERSVDRKREFYKNLSKKLSFDGKETLGISTEVMEKMSPENKLRYLKCRVFILHDYYDCLVPPQHSEKIFHELSARDMAKAQKLLITPLLSHVTARYSLKFLDLFRILSMIGEIFR